MCEEARNNKDILHALHCIKYTYIHGQYTGMLESIQDERTYMFYVMDLNGTALLVTYTMYVLEQKGGMFLLK